MNEKVMSINNEPPCSEQRSLPRGVVIGLVTLVVLFTASSAVAVLSDHLRTFGSGGEKAYSVQNTTDGGYILAGDAIPSEADDRVVWLIKVSGEITGTAGLIESRISSAEKAAGFEVVLAIAILLAAYTAIWKRR